MKGIKIEPAGKGEESVWDYPRPPALVKDSRHVRVVMEGMIVADSRQTYRVLETSHPPVFYIPSADVDMDKFSVSDRQSHCEFKGRASYLDYIGKGKQIVSVAWFYPEPVPLFQAIRNHIAFYPSKTEACYVADELVRAQEGDFYGGWITNEIRGPFKGSPGTWGW